LSGKHQYSIDDWGLGKIGLLTWNRSLNTPKRSKSRFSSIGQGFQKEFWKPGISDLQKVKGIGKQRACQIASMFALSRIRNACEVVDKTKVTRSQDAYTTLVVNIPQRFIIFALRNNFFILRSWNTVEIVESNIECSFPI
jgi:hypothetical protein